MDADALARREAVLLDDEATARAGEGARRRHGLGRRPAGPGVGHAHPGSLGHLVTERLGALDPGGRGGRPERRHAGRPQRVGQAVREGLLGSDDRELDRVRAGDFDDRGVVGGRDLDALDPRQLADRVAARRHDHEVDPGLVGQLPGQGVLTAAATDDEDPGRHHGRAHAGAPVARPAPVSAGERRIGRQARSMVCVRSGPTETSTIGTPAWSSSAET